MQKMGKKDLDIKWMGRYEDKNLAYFVCLPQWMHV